MSTFPNALDSADGTDLRQYHVRAVPPTSHRHHDDICKRAPSAIREYNLYLRTRNCASTSIGENCRADSRCVEMRKTLTEMFCFSLSVEYIRANSENEIAVISATVVCEVVHVPFELHVQAGAGYVANESAHVHVPSAGKLRES